MNLIDERKEKQIPDTSDYTTLQNICISLNLVSIVEQKNVSGPIILHWLKWGLVVFVLLCLMSISDFTGLIKLQL